MRFGLAVRYRQEICTAGDQLQRLQLFRGEDEPPPRDTDARDLPAAPAPAAREVSDEDADASDNSNHGCLQYSKRARKEVDSKKEQKKKAQKKRKEEHLKQAAVDITDDLPLAARGKGKGKGDGRKAKGKWKKK